MDQFEKIRFLKFIEKLTEKFDKIPEQTRNAFETLMEKLEKMYNFENDTRTTITFFEAVDYFEKLKSGKDPYKNFENLDIEKMLEAHIFFKIGFIAGLKKASDKMPVNVSMN